MSNVLIGIIGVILFIGLALAGALFLGPRFQESSNTSKAAAMVQSLAQISQAVNLYETHEGQDIPDGPVTVLVPGYLKNIPTNPGWGSNPAINTAGSIRYIFVDAGGSEAVCQAILRQTGQNEQIPIYSGTGTLNGRTGCYRTGSFLVAWTKI